MLPKKKRTDSGKGAGGNRQIMLATYFFVFLFIGMAGYLGYFTYARGDSLQDNSYNPRQQQLARQNIRGSILAGSGEVLAETVVDEEGEEQRIYPYQELFSHIVGYSTRGRSGIEALGNHYLINSSISLAQRAANANAEKRNPGDNIVTSLDMELQQVASDELGRFKGAVVVTQVKTGRILAMVSRPDFDPNEIAEDWERLSSDTENAVLLNRAAQGLYPPGSTFKIITALEYIRQNPEEYKQYTYTCKGYYQFSESRLNCIHGTKHGTVDFADSLAQSCNASFANMGMSLDREAFDKTLSSLLFGKELPYPLPYSKSGENVSRDMPPAEMMQTSIGQGKTQMTPLHLNMITAAIANQGVLMDYSVIDRVESAEGSAVESFSPQSCARLMSEEEASVLTELMEGVVLNGNAKKLQSEDYTVAGKTGSAEFNDNKADSHAWFTGFAPVEDPEIAVTVIVERAGSGSEYAIPIAKRIFNAWFTGNAYQ